MRPPLRSDAGVRESSSSSLHPGKRQAQSSSEGPACTSVASDADDFLRPMDHDWSRILLFPCNSAAQSRLVRRLDSRFFAGQSPTMITTLVLELVSVLLSSLGVGAWTMRGFDFPRPAPTVRRSCRAANREAFESLSLRRKTTR